MATSVYVINQNESVTSHVSQLFASIGLTTVAHVDPLQLFYNLKVTHPAFVVAGYNLPGMNGLQFLEELKRLQATVPVIFLSQRACVKTAVDALRAGAEDFIVAV